MGYIGRLMHAVGLGQFVRLHLCGQDGCQFRAEWGERLHRHRLYCLGRLTRPRPLTRKERRRRREIHQRIKAREGQR